MKKDRKVYIISEMKTLSLKKGKVLLKSNSFPEFQKI